MENELIEIVRKLYTDVFDNCDCPAVNNYYHDDAVCHFNGLNLSIDSLKSSMRDFVAAHSEIKTTIESIFASGNHTYARLRRDVVEKDTGNSRTILIMVEKRFEQKLVKELWFMVDDSNYAKTWTR